MARRLIAAAACVFLALGDEADVLTPVQRRLLAEVREEAAGASRRAEAALLADLSATSLRLELRWLGAHELAERSPQELLDMLKANLDSLEWTSNFGLDAVSRRLHPGNEAMDLGEIERYGHIPSEWELKAVGSRLVENMSHLEWGVLDAAEAGLYRLPAFREPGAPSAAEVANRPKYLAGNLRRMDTGIEMYGAYAAVLRNGAIRDRALLLGTDSGGWESTCNSSMTPVVRPNWVEKLSVPCAPASLTPLGVGEHQLHTVLANAQTFRHLGGGLARVLYQLLTPGAGVRPIEARMYTEAALLGPMRMVDLKLLVGSFPGLFGTPEGSALRAFCRRHGVPLAWGLSSGHVWADEGSNPVYLLPYEPFESWPAGRVRLLDAVAGWPATNVTSPVDVDAMWGSVWEDVAAARQRKYPRAYGPSKASFEAWWEKLLKASAPVAPLRGRDCADADLCFGTRAVDGTRKDCVCRVLRGASGEAPLVV